MRNATNLRTFCFEDYHYAFQETLCPVTLAHIRSLYFIQVYIFIPLINSAPFFKLGLKSHQPAQFTLNIYYLSHLASERNKSMICLTAILTEHYFLMAFSQMVRKWHIKRIKTNFTTFRKRYGLVKHYALPKQVSSLTKQMIRKSCSQ